MWAQPRQPVTVSPGSSDELSVVAQTCPTFSWGALEEASRYELLVYELVDEQVRDRQEMSPVIHVSLPGTANSWTPSLDRCLAQGLKYEWYLQARDEFGESNWSEGRLFKVQASPGVDEVTSALKVLKSYLERSTLSAEELRGLEMDEISERVREMSKGENERNESISAVDPPEADLPAGTSGIRAEVPDTTGVTYGVVGVSNSSSGAGLAAENSAGGADLMLDGTPLAEVRESGIRRSSASTLSFNIENVGAGSMNLNVDGNTVFTTANDGAGSGLDADLLDGSHRADIQVPPGAVMFFDLASCPVGWTELSSAQGRTIVGRPSGGTLGGTVGAAFGDLENRFHSHSVNPSIFSSSTAGSHSHNVDPASVFSLVSGNHFHTINPPSAPTTGDSHNHQWSQYNGGGWVAYNSSGTGELLTNWDNGVGSEGSGWDPLAITNGSGTRTFFTLSDTHEHSVDIGAFSSVAAGAHSHAVDIPVFSSAAVAAHSHSVDVGATASSNASTSQVIPYLQLLACRKS